MLSIVIIDFKSMRQTISYIMDFINKCVDKEGIHFIVIDNSMDDSNYFELKEYLTIKHDSFREFINNKLYELLESIDFFEVQGITIVAAKCKGNYGYAKGNNIGALISKEVYNDPYLIFSNNDLAFKNKFTIGTLLKYFETDSNIAVIGPDIVDPDNNHQNPRKKLSIWRMLTLRYINMLTPKLLNKLINDIDYTNESKYADWVNGCFMMVDFKKFLEADMFDENTFLYGEELILSERLLRKRYLNFFSNDLNIIHYHGQTVKKAYDIVNSCKLSFDSVYYYYKNYMKCNKFELQIARLSFFIFKKLFPAKTVLLKHLKANKTRI